MSNIEPTYRKDIVDLLVPLAKKDPRIVLMVCDMGFGVTDNFKAEIPDRIFNFGMMEQGTVGISAGMAMTGLVPIVYSITNFLAFRAIEQIRNDVVNQGLNVKFISTGVNDYFKFLGSSHCCGQDDIKLMDMIKLKVYDPYASPDTDFPKMVEEWMNDPQSGYLRV